MFTAHCCCNLAVTQARDADLAARAEQLAALQEDRDLLQEKTHTLRQQVPALLHTHNMHTLEVDQLRGLTLRGLTPPAILHL
jgi:hypothetical protein